PLMEVHNPQLGQKGESGWRPPRASTARRIVVVGAGPAGLQAAAIAAARGHDVTLIGASRALGGKLLREAEVSGCLGYPAMIAWLARQLRDAGAKLELGLKASVADVQALAPHSVILATGSHQRRPDGFAGEGLSARDWAESAQRETAGGRTAVLFDMD